MSKNKLLKFLLTSFLGISSIGAISTITFSCGSKKQDDGSDDEKDVSVTSVSLNKTLLDIQVNETEKLIATVLPENATDKSVTWKSSDESVATVNDNGLVTGISGGTAIITVKTNDGQKEAKCEVNVTVPKVINPYLTIYANEESTFELVNNGGNNPNLQYSYDKGETWTNYSTPITIIKNNNLYLKGNNPDGWSTSSDVYSSLRFTGKVSIYGDITVLIDNGTNSINSIPCNYCFYKLFSDCASIKVVDDLFLSSITTLKQYCYSCMFLNCTSLTNAPEELPAITLQESCYASMFEGCTSLRYAPDLMATTLADWCCSYMFSDCTSLIYAPELLATTLADWCYYSMFYNCTSLIYAPELLATTLQVSCYAAMFEGCTSLTNAPEELPATTLQESCYAAMFEGCTSLIYAPELLATTLADWCYNFMFANCTSLIYAPELLATTLAFGCYYNMFEYCISLTSVKIYYQGGFDSEYFSDWVNDVTSSGTFYYNGIDEPTDFGFPNTWHKETFN